LISDILPVNNIYYLCMIYYPTDFQTNN